MTIQANLEDMVRHCAVAGVEIIKVTGTASETRVQTFDTDKTLFIEGVLATPSPVLDGEFGITNLKMLSGLLGFANYQTEDATFNVRSRTVGDKTVLDQFEFKGAGSKSVFKLMDIQHVPDQAKIASIPWGIVLHEINKAKLAEFTQFAGLYSAIDKNFGVSVEDGDLKMTFGQEASSSHSGSMVFAEKVVGTLTGVLNFPVDKFLMLMKIAQNASEARLMFTSKGLLGVEVVTHHGTYKYFLRQTIG